MSALYSEIAPTRPRFQISILDAPLGAEVLGLDLARPISDNDLLRIHGAHLDHPLYLPPGHETKLAPAD